MRILVVEDSVVLREGLMDGLTQIGHVVDGVGDGQKALAFASTTEYDIVVLDLMIPKVDGLSVLRQLREKGWDRHILILSARDRIDQRVEGLRAGADDYLIKPFAFDELLARIEALGRRAHGIKQQVLTFDGFKIDLSTRSVEVGSARVPLTPLEFSVLECMVLDAGRPVARGEIEDRVYDSDHPVWSNAIDSVVSAIRRKLSDAGCHDAIVTRRGLGYEVPAPSAGDTSS